jgi:hypothetical protein
LELAWLTKWVDFGGAMAKETKIKWLSEPEEHDYPAAKSYLKLLYNERTAATNVEKLKRARICKFKSKDIFRASRLSLLGISNYHVKKDRKKIKAGQSLSPLLLLRDEKNGRVVIADGYHRLCAVYSFDEDAVIPCKIISQ